jgi:FkbM family methyltransferase
MNEVEFKYEMLLDFDFLTNDSIVFDIGTNMGVWTEQIYNKYKPKMYCFEPAYIPYKAIEEKFGKNSDFKLFPHAIGANNRKFLLYLTNEVGGDASEYLEPIRHRHAEVEGKIRVVTQLCYEKEFSAFMEKQEINHIDLMALNCEGAEYNILEYLLKINYLTNIKSLLIQFHVPANGVVVKDWEKRRGDIRKGLESTHNQIWNAPDHFEMWMRKE